MTVDRRRQVLDSAQALANAISERDVGQIRELLTADFLLRTPGHGAEGVDAFIEGIRSIPGEIISVRLEDVEIDLTCAGALVTGLQRSQLQLDGKLVDDIRPFVDLFVESEPGRWRIQVAVNLPSA